MTLIEFFNYIYVTLTGVELPPIDDIMYHFDHITHWTQIFNPVYFITSIVYFLVGWFIIQFCFILPVRYLKKIIGFPSRKGSER